MLIAPLSAGLLSPFCRRRCSGLRLRAAIIAIRNANRYQPLTLRAGMQSHNHPPPGCSHTHRPYEHLLTKNRPPEQVQWPCILYWIHHTIQGDIVNTHLPLIFEIRTISHAVPDYPYLSLLAIIPHFLNPCFQRLQHCLLGVAFIFQRGSHIAVNAALHQKPMHNHRMLLTLPMQPLVSLLI